MLGPVLGVLLCDYFTVRKMQLKLPDLYKTDGAYSYFYGVNPMAMVALLVGILVAFSGNILPIDALAVIKPYTWFTGFFSSYALYALLMSSSKTDAAASQP